MAIAFSKTQLITSSPKFYLNFPALLSDKCQNKIKQWVGCKPSLEDCDASSVSVGRSDGRRAERQMSLDVLPWDRRPCQPAIQPATSLSLILQMRGKTPKTECCKKVDMSAREREICSVSIHTKSNHQSCKSRLWGGFKTTAKGIAMTN